MNEENVRKTLTSILPGIDEDVLDYFQSMILDCDLDDLTESLAPFIESYGFADDIEKAEIICNELCKKLKDFSSEITKDNKNHKKMTDAEYSSAPKLLDKAIQLSETTKNQISEHEQASIDTMWGFDKIRDGRNQTIEMTEAGSAKYERKAQKDQRKWLEELESKFVGDDDNNEQISSMVLPDFSGNSREKDIQVNNFRITYGGNILLDEADLRLVYGRRYGLIGRNGIGKTTLLKHMATFDIEGFPRHHRVLHVKQEVKSSDMLVLEVVLAADIERTSLINREIELLKLQAECSDDKELSQILIDLAQVNERMNIISVHTAESRAASILSGLQFSDEMQKSTTESLSGGWRMRVALAGALFIEPDLLMLDEPTNHLDLEAVLWLQKYLQSYKHTILLVSHDRAFLNDVCTDTILFKNLKLNYYRGNYDMFIATRTEALLVQARQYEAQQVKIAHMQEFVDKFRYNAKRASLVQSRIKTIERETTIDAVEDEEKGFSFNFIDSGQLGRPVIQIQELTFGYSPDKILFRNVDFNIDQTSRIALVGPNGAGKSTLLNLIKKELTPTEGYVLVNSQLRLGIFTQHHLDSFDLTVSALQNMLNKWPKALEADLRGHLGKYEISGNDALKPLKFTSGGQKSRVAFACLTYGKPHVVILDEPTNHLDMGAIEALSNALKSFTGGVLVISHDQHFISNVCNEIWVVDNKKVTKFNGGFEDYRKESMKIHKK